MIEPIQTDVDAYSGNCLHKETTVRFGIVMPTEVSWGSRMLSLRFSGDSTYSVSETKTKTKELKGDRSHIFWSQTQNRIGETGAMFPPVQFLFPMADSTTSRWHKEERRMFRPYVCVCPFLQEGKLSAYLWQLEDDMSPTLTVLLYLGEMWRLGRRIISWEESHFTTMP